MSDNNNCCICYGEIEDGDTYKIPECQHDSFHTQCIVQWFRTGQRRCPMCNDQGQSDANNCAPPTMIKLAKRKSRKEDADPLLKELCSKLDKTELEVKDIKKKLRDIKNEEGVFGKLKQRHHKLCTRFNKKMFEIVSIKKTIAMTFPTTNLIIVSRKEIE